MSAVRFIQLRSVDQVRDRAAAWDDLWQRSDVASPTAGAELLSQWIEQFAAGQRLRVLAVEQGQRLMAALPLVGVRLHGLLELAGLPVNCWSASGELLLDPHADDETIDRLIAEFRQLPWPLLWLEGVNLDAHGWQRLVARLAALGIEHELAEQYRVGYVDIAGDWPAFEQSWSKNHRKNMRKTRERLEQQGSIRLVKHRPTGGAQIEALLRRAFEVEDRSWKALAGSSVLRSAGMFDFFCQQAQFLARQRQLEVSFLELAGEPIAFEYGYRAKGVYFSHKVGYDERYSEFGPGQLLMLELLKAFHEDPDISGLDCLGPLSDAVSRWTTHSYASGRLIVAPRRILSTTLLATYRAAGPWARRLRS